MISRARSRIAYGWVVVAALTLITFIIMGLSSSFGIFFKSFQQAFDLTRASTSSVLSVRMALGCAFALLGGWAIDRYGPRLVLFTMGVFIGISLVLTSLANYAWQLFITYGFLMAVGVGAIYVVMSSTVLRWFGRRRGLALGITGAGGGLGMVAVAPLAAFLIESLQWRSALLVLGAIACLIVLPASRLVKREPQGVRDRSGGDVSTSVSPAQDTHRMAAVFRMTGFWVFLFVWVLMAFSMFFILAHIVPHATDMGLSAVESATVLSLIGIGMVAGRFVAGVVTERISAKAVAIVCCVLQIGALLWFVSAKGPSMLYLIGALYGLSQGGFSVSTTMLVGEVFGMSHIGKILGLLEVGFSGGAAAGPFIGGLVFDVTGKYATVFFIVAAATLANVFLVAMIKSRGRADQSA